MLKGHLWCQNHACSSPRFRGASIVCGERHLPAVANEHDGLATHAINLQYCFPFELQRVRGGLGALACCCTSRCSVGEEKRELILQRHACFEQQRAQSECKNSAQCALLEPWHKPERPRQEATSMFRGLLTWPDSVECAWSA